MNEWFFEVIVKLGVDTLGRSVVKSKTLVDAVAAVEETWPGSFTVGARVVGPPEVNLEQFECDPFKLSGTFDVFHVLRFGAKDLGMRVSRIDAITAMQAISRVQDRTKVVTGLRMVGGPIAEFTLYGKII